jgi:hypothetical protein
MLRLSSSHVHSAYILTYLVPHRWASYRLLRLFPPGVSTYTLPLFLMMCPLIPFASINCLYLPITNLLYFVHVSRTYSLYNSGYTLSYPTCHCVRAHIKQTTHFISARTTLPAMYTYRGSITLSRIRDHGYISCYHRGYI